MGFRIGRHPRPEHLDGDRPLEGRLIGLEDHSHAPLPDDPPDFVVAKLAKKAGPVAGREEAELKSDCGILRIGWSGKVLQVLHGPGQRARRRLAIARTFGLAGEQVAHVRDRIQPVPAFGTGRQMLLKRRKLAAVIAGEQALDLGQVRTSGHGQFSSPSAAATSCRMRAVTRLRAMYTAPTVMPSAAATVSTLCPSTTVRQNASHVASRNSLLTRSAAQ